MNADDIASLFKLDPETRIDLAVALEDHLNDQVLSASTSAVSPLPPEEEKAPPIRDKKNKRPSSSGS